MVTVLKKGTAKINIQKLMVKLANDTKKRGVDTSKYCGKLNLKNDPILIQKDLRNEWE